MKKVRLLLPLFLLVVIPVTVQVEHALIPEQCRADADAWGIPKVTGGTLTNDSTHFADIAGAMTHDRTVTAKEIDARIKQLGQFEKIDSGVSTQYSQARRSYAIAELARMADFMQRHSLTGKFYEEDNQGKR